MDACHSSFLIVHACINVAAFNVGNIQHGISPGPIDNSVIEKMLPWDDTRIEGLLSGTDIKDMLEHSAGGGNDFNYDSHTLLIQTFALNSSWPPV